MSTSEWARRMYEDAVERGDSAAADDYIQIYTLWKEREAK